MKILLIAGGWSDERQVSLNGGAILRAALESLGHAVTFYDPADRLAELPALAAAHDFAFLNLHGSPGEDGLIQAMLDAVGLPYQGSGPAGSFLALHKAAAKTLYRHAGLRTPDWEFHPAGLALGPGGQAATGLPFPVFVKPNQGGSSLGARLCADEAEFADFAASLHAQGLDILVEPALSGQELTCAVLGDAPLPVILIRPKGAAFFDYASKYVHGGAEEICPAPIPADLAAAVQAAALKAHQLLGLAGYSRSDFIHDGRDLWILETNTLPGMTATSLVPQAAAASGLTFEGLAEELIRLGQAERGRR